jgi:hypothetical protein
MSYNIPGKTLLEIIKIDFICENMVILFLQIHMFF